MTCLNLQNFLIIKSTNSVKQENDFISLVDRVPDVGNNFRDFYDMADANMDLFNDANMELDDYDVDFTNHTFQTFESKVLEVFKSKIPGSLENFDTIGEKKTEIMDIIKVLFDSSCVFL